MMKHFFYILLLRLAYTQGTAQRGMLKSARNYFEAGLYQEAIKYYNQYPKVEKNKEAIYERGIAYLHTNEVDLAIKDLTKAYSLGIEEKEVYYYVGKAMHSKNQFRDAVKFYKNYLRYEDDETIKYEVIDRIKRCASGINSRYNEQLAFVENLGSSVNTIYDELRPIQSPNNQNKYYFSSNRDDATGGMRTAEGLKDEIYGKYSADMYAVELNDGNWTAVNAFYPLLNGPQDEILQDFDPSGSVMYFLRTKRGQKGEMLTDTFVADRPEGAYPRVLESPVIAKLGDKDVSVFSGDVILFSSNREGGYGGYDIYIAVQKEGEWMEPMNLGPGINTPYDERTPYLSHSGSKLYFSSDRLESIGGFDIFSINYNMESSSWSQVSNVGMPINSAKNDLGFTLSADGTVGLFSSDRIESKGGFDIYMAYLKDQITDQFGYALIPSFLQSSLTPDTVFVSTDSLGITEEKIIVSKPVTPVKAREYLNTPLYYGKDENILTPQNTDRLDNLAELLTIYPETRVILTCNSMPEGLPEFDLYFSIKRAEKAADFLVDLGVDDSRITIRGLGANFPVTQSIVNGRISRLAEKNNRRVDIDLIGIESTNLTIIEDYPVVSDNFKDDKGERYKDIVNGLSYKVLISTVKQMYKGSVLKKYNHSTIERKANEELYDYTLGLFDRYSEARMFKDNLVREGMSDATILPYLNGLPIDEDNVASLLNKYPDLSEYLKYK